MKRFSKLLIFILAFAIVSVFTIVSLAEEPASPFLIHEFDFEGKTGSDNVEKIGKWSVVTSDDGENDYLVGEYAEGTGTNGDNKDINFNGSWSLMGRTPVDTSGYAIQKYPSFAFDFDVMSTTGKYNNSTVRFDLYGGENPETRITQLENISFSGLGLSADPYNWQHVTIVFTYEGDGIFRYSFFVNGVEAKTSYTKDYSSKVMDGEELKYDNIRVSYVSFYPERDVNNVEQKICMDNWKFLYYPIGYSAEQIANSVYGADYDLPSGKTVATITDNETGTVTPYETIGKAIAAAKKNDVIDILVNTYTTYEVNNEITDRTSVV